MTTLITGGTGFLGKALQYCLRAAGESFIAVGTKNFDLCDRDDTHLGFAAILPQKVYHLAALCGGIGANSKSPADFWSVNLQMGLNVLDACVDFNVQKLILVGTTCSYPAEPDSFPFLEEDLFEGRPEASNAPYGIAKLALLEGARAYRKQYGLDVSIVVPANLYGVGDHYDEENSHVIPALIRKFHKAKEGKYDTVEVWGSGKATRDFLYVDDAAAGLVAAEALKDSEPVNLGSGLEISIAGLVEAIASTVGYTGSVRFDTSKPDGQTRRRLDITRAKRLLGWDPKTSLEDGLRQTYYDFLRRGIK